MSIWKACQGEEQIKSIDKMPWRVVESQSILTSRILVDSHKEYELLEAMVEASKPVIDTNKHYLLFTPFRYPPLRYGSRFGPRFERGLWYGSLELTTALREVAHYRFLFHQDTEADLGTVNTALTAYQAWVKTKRGIDLTKHPFEKYQAELTSREDYSASQALGSQMRNSQVEAFIFRSARSDIPSENLGAYTPKVFHRKANNYVFNTQSWQCSTNKTEILFINQDSRKIKLSVSEVG